MNGYESSIPRLACGIAAVAIATITIGLLVVLPSKLEPDSRTFATLAMANGFTATQCEARQ